MRLLIAGSRNLFPKPTDIVQLLLLAEIDYFDVDEIVSGCAKGVDQCGEKFAEMCDIPVETFPALWNQHGKKAGVIRNAEMAEHCDKALIIWDGKTRGTKNMIDNMVKQGKPYFLAIIHKNGKDFKAKWFKPKQEGHL